MRSVRPLFGAVLCAVILVIGCQDGKPLGPYRVTSLSVSIPPTGELRSSLFNSGSNELLYRLDGTGTTPVTGILGPFSTSGASGSIDFNLDIPGGDKRILSLQINDAGTHLPLAVGAASIDFTSNTPVTNILVEMGSVTRTCYYTGYGISFQYGYNFATDSMGATNTGDMASYTAAGAGGPATLYNTNFVTPQNTIAYMGNGNLVDFDKVPPATDFYSISTSAKTSGPIQIGDIFCIKLTTIPGGYAWIQVTDPGNGTMYRATSFRFRLNSTKSYFAYERTQADMNSTCSGTY